MRSIAVHSTAVRSTAVRSTVIAGGDGVPLVRQHQELPFLVMIALGCLGHRLQIFGQTELRRGIPVTGLRHQRLQGQQIRQVSAASLQIERAARGDEDAQRRDDERRLGEHRRVRLGVRGGLGFGGFFDFFGHDRLFNNLSAISIQTLAPHIREAVAFADGLG
ncbi:MAG: hypothetical protein EXS28_10000 [Pedosphaera sp.]|nr:hypothetical protein [Pedosphaera sp.]